MVVENQRVLFLYFYFLVGVNLLLAERDLELFLYDEARGYDVWVAALIFPVHFLDVKINFFYVLDSDESLEADFSSGFVSGDQVQVVEAEACDHGVWKI